MSKHVDDRFPQAENNYACGKCKEGDHLHCRPKIAYIGWEHTCACNDESPAAHQDLRNEREEERLADLIEPHVWEYPETFCECNAGVSCWGDYVQHLAKVIREGSPVKW